MAALLPSPAPAARKESALDLAYANCQAVMKSAPAAPFLGSDFALVQETARRATISQVFFTFLELIFSAKKNEAVQIKRIFVCLKLIAAKDAAFAGEVDLNVVEVCFQEATNSKVDRGVANTSVGLSCLMFALECTQLCHDHAKVSKRMVEFNQAGFAYQNIIILGWRIGIDAQAREELIKKVDPFHEIEGLISSGEITGTVLDFTNFELTSFVLRWAKFMEPPKSKPGVPSIVPMIKPHEFDDFVNKFKNHKRDDIRIFARLLIRIRTELKVIFDFQNSTTYLNSLFSFYQKGGMDRTVSLLCTKLKLDPSGFLNLYKLIEQRCVFYFSKVDNYNALCSDETLKEFQGTIDICKKLRPFLKTVAFAYTFFFAEFEECCKKKRPKLTMKFPTGLFANSRSLPYPNELERIFFSNKPLPATKGLAPPGRDDQKGRSSTLKASGLLQLLSEEDVLAIRAGLESIPPAAAQGAAASAASAAGAAGAGAASAATALIAALGAPLSASASASAAAAPASTSASTSAAASASAAAAAAAVTADTRSFQVVAPRKRQIPPEVRALFAKRKLPFVPTYHPHLATQRDKHHAFSKLVDRFIGTSYSKMSRGKSRKGDEIYIYQIAGEIDGVRGTFEYFFTLKGLLIHRFFSRKNAETYFAQWDAIDAGAIESSEALLQRQEAGVKWETQEEGGVSIDDLDLVTIEDALAPGTIRLVNLGGEE